VLAFQFGLLPLQLGPLRLVPQFLLLPLLSRLPLLLGPLPLPLICRRPLPLRFRILLSLPLLSRSPLLLSPLPLPLVCRRPLPRLICINLSLPLLGRGGLIVGPRDGRCNDTEAGQQGGAQQHSTDES
jgi:hypothetical protein